MNKINKIALLNHRLLPELKLLLTVTAGQVIQSAMYLQK